MDTKKYSEYADKFKVDRNLVKEIFVDETLVKIDGQNYWLWIAYDDDEPNIYIHSCLLFHIYLKRKNDFFVCYQFFKQIRTKFGRRKKPIYTDDGAYWYNDMICICKWWLKLKHIIYGTELKNIIIERFIQHK